MEAEVGVQSESQIERRGVFGQCDELAFGRKDKYLGTEQVELYRVEKIDGVGLGVFENVFDGFQPDVEFRLFVGVSHFVFRRSRPFFRFVFVLLSNCRRDP